MAKYDVTAEAKINATTSIVVRIEAESPEEAKRQVGDMANNVETPVGGAIDDQFTEEGMPNGAFEVTILRVVPADEHTPALEVTK